MLSGLLGLNACWGLLSFEVACRQVWLLEEGLCPWSSAFLPRSGRLEGSQERGQVLGLEQALEWESEQKLLLGLELQHRKYIWWTKDSQDRSFRRL